LLAAITRCRRAGDDGCSVAVAPESTGAIEALRVFEGEPPAVELVDEYGDVAVLRLTAAAAPSARTEEEPRRSTHERIVVLRRQDDRWLVRDVYDVADQPS
jgi:23S rRNA G2069 N7-methylase RlmK/C1962 C5-methylase RlmI